MWDVPPLSEGGGVACCWCWFLDSLAQFLFCSDDLADWPPDDQLLLSVCCCCRCCCCDCGGRSPWTDVFWPEYPLEFCELSWGRWSGYPGCSFGWPVGVFWVVAEKVLLLPGPLATLVAWGPSSYTLPALLFLPATCITPKTKLFSSRNQ